MTDGGVELAAGVVAFDDAAFDCGRDSAALCCEFVVSLQSVCCWLKEKELIYL